MLEVNVLRISNFHKWHDREKLHCTENSINVSFQASCKARQARAVARLVFMAAVNLFLRNSCIKFYLVTIFFKIQGLLTHFPVNRNVFSGQTILTGLTKKDL